MVNGCHYVYNALRQATFWRKVEQGHNKQRFTRIVQFQKRCMELRLNGCKRLNWETTIEVSRRQTNSSGSIRAYVDTKRERFAGQPCRTKSTHVRKHGAICDTS